METNIPKGSGQYKDDFEHFLQEIHGEQYIGTDDCMPDDFIEWVEVLCDEDWFELGDKFAKRKSAELLRVLKSALGEWKLHHSLIDTRKLIEQAIKNSEGA